GTPIASATLHVPAGLIDKYKATAPWNEFGNIVGEGNVTIDGLNYYLNSSFYTAPLIKGNNWEGELDIPSEVSFYGQTYTVTCIARAAFFDNSKLTKVRIPKSLESILRGYYTTNPYEDVPTGLVSSDHMNPFRGCTALESIEVDEENPSLKSVDGVLFSQDGRGYYYYQTNSYYGTGLYCYPAGARRESYTIPNGVEWIGSGAFEDNQYISTLTIPSSMKMIYYSVFSGCSNLKNVYCYAEDVPIAFSEAFKGFPVSSATLHVPAGSLEKYKATAPWNEFGNIVALPAVANEYIDPQTNVVYTYEPGQGTASVKAGYEEAQSTGFGEGEVFFYSGSPDAEGDIVILDRFSVGTEEYVVTRIGEGAFRENSKIKSVSIPETVTDIGKLAFCWCDSLTSVQLPSGLTKIAPWLFCCCNQLMSVTIPSSVSTIGERAFADCGSLANITLPESLTSIGYGVFSNCYFVADSFINKSTLTSSNKWGATLCDMETSEGLMLKDNGVVFCRPWTWINSVTIPNGVTSIEKNAFMDRSGLTSVTIPYSVTSIGEDAFLRCFGLSSVTIPSSVTKIGNSAFCLCYGLTSVTIGSGMASIGAGAFYECRNLRNVCCYAEDVPDTGINTFEGLPIASATLHVPAGSVDSYKAVSPWNEFGNIVAIEKIAQEYFPEGTKWTEIRLDTLKYDSWYSKIGDDWVPNFETIEYRVQGIYSNFSETFGDNSLKCVYTNCSEWTDSLSLLIVEGEINEYLNYGRRVMATVPIYFDTWDVPSPAMAYNFDWRVGMPISFIDILSTTYDHNSETAVFGIIEEINEGNFGGVRPLNYTDVNGVRIIQGIGVTTWNDGECIFGPVRPYDAMAFHQGIVYPERHYRSMLVHFERDG
ncbi:MAG: leucine-rich repeat protein, partial [Bacteroidales bacterium]|nr:leucine-rich repeat protein [Bacteroidales bacterium]